MELQSVKELLESGDPLPSSIDFSVGRFYNVFTIHGIHVDLIEPGRVLCSMKVPPRFLNGANVMDGGAISSLIDVIGSVPILASGATTSGVTVEINVSYLDSAFLDEVIEIEAKSLLAGKAIAVVTVELRKKETGKVFAQGRHTKYLAASSKL